jgi:Ca2+-dependent lipid-binding protein
MAGIGSETCVWFNAFAGRMFRDAITSPLYRDKMTRTLEAQLNKDSHKRPAFLSEMRVTSLRFGSMPPLLSNARWVPASTLDHAHLAYDVAMAAEISYEVRHEDSGIHSGS